MESGGPCSHAGEHRCEQAEVSVATNRFRWDKVESTDYFQYIANLRTVGCPDETVRDIVLADVRKLYARERRVWEQRASALEPAVRTEAALQLARLRLAEEQTLNALLNSAWRQDLAEISESPQADDRTASGPPEQWRRLG